jgi:hypothetical protein
MKILPSKSLFTVPATVRVFSDFIDFSYLLGRTNPLDHFHTCCQCRCSFAVPSHKRGPRKYCPECGKRRPRKKLQKTCPQCGGTFETTRPETRFCGASCAQQARYAGERRTKRRCRTCGEAFHAVWWSRNWCCSTRCSRTWDDRCQQAIRRARRRARCRLTVPSVN